MSVSHIVKNGDTTENFRGSMEKIALNSMHKEDKTDSSTIAIIGNGNYGKALALRFTGSDLPVLIGSRDPTRRKFLPTQANLVSYKDAAQKGEIVFICIPVFAYQNVIPDLQDDLLAKTVVDISNPTDVNDPCGAQLLQDLLPGSKVVKALNTVSAWALESDAFGGSRETYVCGNDKESRQAVAQVVRELGLSPVDSGRLKAAEKIEKLSLKLFPEWSCAITLTAFLAAFCIFYYYLRLFGANQQGMKGVNQLALYHANRIICWIALWLFSLVYLPGCLAGYIQIWRGTKYRPFPCWLDTWMRSRKQLGLIALLVASMHACISLIVLGGEQVKYMSTYVNVPETSVRVFRGFTWNAEPSLLFATISFTAFAVLGITSLPTVNARMSWKEWNFVQSKIGYFGLVFATAHVLIYAYSVFDPSNAFKYWKWNMPPAVFLQPLLPALVLVLKAILMLPGINGYLWSIRGGWERSSSGTKNDVIRV